MTKLKEILESKGLKQCWIAKQIGVTERQMSNLVAGVRHVKDREKHLAALMAFLGVSEQELCDVEPENE